MGSEKKKIKWKIWLHKSNNQAQQSSIPLEFLCPISGSIMADPVIVSSGHTFERNCILACVSLSFLPAAADFSALIPNHALHSAILTWCRRHLPDPPPPLDFYSALEIVRRLATESEFTRKPSSDVSISATSSDESATPRDRPSSSSSPDMETPTTTNNRDSGFCLEEADFVIKLKSAKMEEQQDTVVSLRRLTRTHTEARVDLCTPPMLSALKSLIRSRYPALQADAAAALVNLSLERQNKVKIVRSGIVPPLIEILRGGGDLSLERQNKVKIVRSGIVPPLIEILGGGSAAAAEAREHAAGALFSLSLDDQNKTAIGVLGALPPLLHALRAESERTRHDSCMALHHLSLVQSNRVKLIRLGAVEALLGMVRSGHMGSRVMLVLRSLAGSAEGRAAMLDGGAVECLVSCLSRGESVGAATRESCVAAIYGLSGGGLRFKGLAMEAGAEEVLMEAVEMVRRRGKEKVKRIIEVMHERDGEEDDWVNSEEDLSPTRRNKANSC